MEEFRERKSLQPEEEVSEKEQENILDLHPDKVIILVSKAPKSRLKDLPNNKLLISKDFKMHRLLALIRSKIGLSKQQALYLFSGKVLLQVGQKVEEVFEKHKSSDNCLRLEYYEYQTFG